MTERLPSVCPDCGGVFHRDDTAARCTDCEPRRWERPSNYGRGSSTARGYDYAWRKLSERARKRSPVCEDCGSPYDLTTDHSAEAWRRRELGKVIRLRDVAVVCRRCNSERGAARGALASGHERWERPDLAQLVDELDRDEAFRDKLDRSSFGTPEAKAAMASVPQEKVDKVLARVEELRRESDDLDRDADEGRL